MVTARNFLSYHQILGNYRNFELLTSNGIRKEKKIKSYPNNPIFTLINREKMFHCLFSRFVIFFLCYSSFNVITEKGFRNSFFFTIHNTLLFYLTTIVKDEFISVNELSMNNYQGVFYVTQTRT